MVFLKRVKKGRRYIRRVNTITEVVGYDRKNHIPVTNNTFKWSPKTDTFDIVNKSFLLKRIADNTTLSEADIEREIKKRASIIEWMSKNNIRDYRKVGKVLNAFYINPSSLFQNIEGSI